MAKRKYTKRSEYWTQFKTNEHPSKPSSEEPSPELLGEPFYTSSASYDQVSQARRQGLTQENYKGSRTNRVAFRNPIDRFSSIRIGMLPYEYASDGVTCRDAIDAAVQCLSAGVDQVKTNTQRSHESIDVESV